MPGEENGGYSYPLTNMNFLVTFGENLTAAFTEVSGVEATVEEIEFRQGNSTSLAPVKIPGAYQTRQRDDENGLHDRQPAHKLDL